ncbi:MAG: hypothetical protein HOQ24_11870, partial [Mycobacteriaceae bacterium]|nr:hypothetical protein [Mycobacteriaceae bacterium]
GGCRLTFVTTLDDLPVAQTATGWHTYLSRLEPHLAGGFVSEDDAHTSWRAIHEGCAERFGLDPEPGRRWAAQICPPRKADRSRTLPLSVSAPD